MCWKGAVAIMNVASKLCTDRTYLYCVFGRVVLGVMPSLNQTHNISHSGRQGK